MELKGKQIYVCPFRSREERLTEVAAGDAYTNLGYGFVNFLEPCAAKRAVEELNGKEVTPGKKLHVSKAQTSDERRVDTMNRMKHMSEIRYVQFMDDYVFVKKMPSFFDEAN
ncbi:poly(A) binding protein [Carabus blaptoides fortunei]